MAIEKTVVIKADTSQANKGINQVDKNVKKLEKSTKQTGKAASKSAKLFQGLGTAIKATGIGLIIAGVAKLTMAFSSNTVVSKVLKETFETINLVFGGFVDAIVSAVDQVSKANGSFKALSSVVSGVVNIALSSLKLTFYGIKLAVQQAMLAWEKSFFGGKDKDKIEELNESIEKTEKAIIKTGKSVAGSVKDIGENFTKAISEIVDFGTKAVDNITKISIKNAKELAKQLVKLRGESVLAIARNELILKTKQKEAELQRQIRDDIELDLKTRVKANKEIEKILKESQKIQIENANISIKLSKLEVQATGGNIDSKEKLIRAELAYQDVLETTDGFLSEQKTNRASLNQEEIELQNTATEAEKERRLDQLEFEAAQEETENGKIEKLRERLEVENELLLEDLENKKEIYKEGTQARVDSEQEYLTAKQELEQKSLELVKRKNEDKQKTDEASANFERKLGIDTLSLLGSLAEEGSSLGKAVAVSQAVISTYQGINKALAETTDFTPTQSLRFANAAIVGASGFANVASILSTSSKSSSASAQAPSTPQVSAPSFNLVQGTGTDQIANSINNQDRPIKAFVVSSDVTNQQELDRNAVETASL
jgi:hypothetical protein